jgi:hypothetical protein
LKPPPRDATGTTEPHDHSEIEAEGLLIRRIDPIQHVVPDENRNCRRISTKAFQPSSEPKGGMSVDLKQLMDEAAVDARNFVTTPKHIGSVYFKASAARTADLLVGYDPLNDNAYHGEVWGKNRPNRFSKTQSQALLNACSWFVEIPDVEI